MNQQKIENLSALCAQERLEYFVRKVADFEALWGAFDDGWLVLGDGQQQVIALWPEEEIAQHYLIQTGLPSHPKKIHLEHFLEKWVVGMARDETQVAVFPVKGQECSIVHPAALARLLDDELQQYDD